MDNNFDFKNQYNNNSQPNFNSGREGLETAALICGIASIVLGYFTAGFLGLPLGVIAILLGIFSKGIAVIIPKKGIWGIVLGVAGIIISIVMLIFVFYMMKNPNVLKQLSAYSEYLNKQ